MALDDKQNGVDQFMDFAEEQETVIPAESYDPETKFMQRGLNAYADATGGTPLKEDGILGPKTQAGVQKMIQTLPPEMKRWAVNKLYKEMNKGEGDGGAGNVAGFQPQDDTEVNPFG
tara:strand:- start:270 stop:620 length:351 start_codon:yes stop_codon:yes gene_type:complete